MSAVIPPVPPASAGITHDFLTHAAPNLARDIALQLDSAQALAKNHYGLTDQQWAVLQRWPPFVKQVEVAMIETSGALGTAERIRRKALLALDTVGILDAATIAGDPKVGAATRLSAIETLMAAGGIGGKAQTGGNGPGAGPLFVINLPGAPAMAFDVARQPAVIEGEVVKHD